MNQQEFSQNTESKINNLFVEYIDKAKAYSDDEVDLSNFVSHKISWIFENIISPLTKDVSEIINSDVEQFEKLFKIDGTDFQESIVSKFQTLLKDKFGEFL